MAAQRWSAEEWLAALADGETERQTERFAKDAESSRARRPPPENDAGRKLRLAADFERAADQRASQERARLAAVKTVARSAKGHCADDKTQTQGIA